MRLRLSVMMFLQWAVPGSVVPMFTVRLENLGFTPMQIAFCAATQAVAAVMSSLVAGRVADRLLSAEKAMAVCAAACAVDLWVLSSLHDFAGVFAATLVFWMFCGPLNLLGVTVAFRNLADPQKQFGGVRLWGTVGWMVVGYLITAWLASAAAFGYAPTLDDATRIGSVLAALLCGFTLTLPATPPLPAKGAESSLAGVFRLLTVRPFAVYCVCLLAIQVTFPFSTQNTPLLLRERGFTQSWIPTLSTISQVTEVALLALMPLLITRLGLRGTMLMGLAAWATRMACLATAAPDVVILAAMALDGLFITGFMISGQVFVNTIAHDDLKASAQGLLACVNGTGLLLGHLFAGYVRAFARGNLPPTFAVAAGVTVVTLAAFALTFRPVREPVVADEGQPVPPESSPEVEVPADGAGPTLPVPTGVFRR